MWSQEPDKDSGYLRLLGPPRSIYQLFQANDNLSALNYFLLHQRTVAFDLAVIEKYAGVLECVDQRLVVVVEIPLAPIRRIEIHVHHQRFAVAFVQAIAQHVLLHIRTVLVALLAYALHHPGVLA